MKRSDARKLLSAEVSRDNALFSASQKEQVISYLLSEIKKKDNTIAIAATANDGLFIANKYLLDKVKELEAEVEKLNQPKVNPDA